MLCFCACGHKPYPQSLMVVDSLVNVCPEGALIVLDSLKNEMKDASKEEQIYYQFLCIKANDKAYIQHTSDSLIQQVLTFYVDKDDDRHLMEAYYYAGRVYRDLGDAPQALDYFMKAVESMKHHGDLPIKSRVYSQMGTLFLYQHMYDEALNMYRKAQICDAIMKDSVGMVFNLRDIAFTYCFKAKIDSSLYYYQNAYNIVHNLQDTLFSAMIQSQMAGMYMRLGEYRLANEYLQPALNHLDPPSKSGIFSIASELYHRMGNLDSAIYYYKELLNDGTVYAQKAAYRGLAEISLSRNNLQQASVYFHKYELFSDSVEKLTNIETIHRMNSLYNYQLHERENYYLRAENKQKQMYIFAISFIAVFVLLSSVAAILHYRWKQAQLKLQMERLKQLKKEQYLRSLQFIKENNRKLEELELKLQEADQTNSTLTNLLEEQKVLLLCTNKQVEKELARREQSKSLLQKTTIYKHIRKQLNIKNLNKNILSDKDWAELDNALNCTYEHFTERLYDLYELKEHEYHVCLLLKFFFSFSEIAQITNRSKEGIISTCRRLYKKVLAKEGTAKEWEDFIHTL